MGITFDKQKSEFSIKLNKSLYSKESIVGAKDAFLELCSIKGDLVEDKDYYVLNFVVNSDESLEDVAYGFTDYVLGDMINQLMENDS